MSILPGSAVAAAVAVLAGCVWLEDDVRLGDPEVQVTERLPSPDRTRIVFEYSQDLGALGFTGGAALLPATDTSLVLGKFRLPHGYDPVHWNADNSLTVRVRLIPCLQRHATCEDHREVRFGTTIHVEFDDEIGDRPVLVEDRLRSPDGQLDLVAYRYPSVGRLNPIHISIVRAGERFPKYGNFFIGHISSDGLMAGQWTGSRAIQFRTSQAHQSFSTYGFIANPWGIQYQVIVDPSLERSYLWHRARPR